MSSLRAGRLQPSPRLNAILCRGTRRPSLSAISLIGTRLRFSASTLRAGGQRTASTLGKLGRNRHQITQMFTRSTALQPESLRPAYATGTRCQTRSNQDEGVATRDVDRNLLRKRTRTLPRSFSVDRRSKLPRRCSQAYSRLRSTIARASRRICDRPISRAWQCLSAERGTPTRRRGRCTFAQHTARLVARCR